MATFNDLQDELLQIILLLLKEAAEKKLEKHMYTTWFCSDLTRLLRISSRLTKVAMATPSLWTHIPVMIQDTKADRWLLERWIERSNPAPLDIMIHCDVSRGRAAVLLDDHVDRWRSVTFCEYDPESDIEIPKKGVSAWPNFLHGVWCPELVALSEIPYAQCHGYLEIVAPKLTKKNVKLEVANVKILKWPRLPGLDQLAASMGQR